MFSAAASIPSQSRVLTSLAPVCPCSSKSSARRLARNLAPPASKMCIPVGLHVRVLGQLHATRAWASDILFYLRWYRQVPNGLNLQSSCRFLCRSQTVPLPEDVTRMACGTRPPLWSIQVAANRSVSRLTSRVRPSPEQALSKLTAPHASP